ncbi:MAG: amidohydrolase family protein [Myxococcales bacterium]|nr:amidohydrolase family protein [Myxococcales bacterium]
MDAELLIRGGLVFDGTGADPARADVAVAQGKVVAVGRDLPARPDAQVFDATGQWVTPGFFDNHTHYDAEVLAAPGLRESVRHGVTTVLMGSCSLGTVLSPPEDTADVFARVEALPHGFVLDTLRRHQTWQTPAGYAAALDAMPLGPNVACYLGHSDLRVAAMGLGPATDGKVRPSAEQMAVMEGHLHAALDAGFLGFSSMTNPWDKVGGDRFRSRRLPSTYATWGEYRRFHAILRDRGAILQSAPNITTKVNVLLFLAASAGFGVRKPLKTALITAADVKANPTLARAVTDGVRLVNRGLGANVRWQSVPMPFEVYADGVDLVVFEEFGAGEAALHLQDHLARVELFRDPAYRARFKKDYARKFAPRVWHRDLYDAQIVACPDAALVGRSIGAVADARGQHPIDGFLDLVIEHGPALRWRTTIANHRAPQLARLAAHPAVQVGFADSGAHLRNMAFYDFPLHWLRIAKRAEDEGNPLMSMGKAVARVTGEQAAWYGLDAGHLRVGDRADIAVVDPARLDAELDAYHEAPMPGVPGLDRMVKRNHAVTATVIGGAVVYQGGAFVEGFGREGHGRFLRAGERTTPRTAAAVRH